MVNNGTTNAMSSNVSIPVTQGVNKTASFFNSNMQPMNSIYANKWHRVTSINDTVKTQQNPFTPIAHSALRKNIIQISQIAQATGTVGAGFITAVTTTLTPTTPHLSDINYAIPFIGVYLGTNVATANQLWPNTGGSTIANQFIITGGYDYDPFSTELPSFAASPFSVSVYNNGTTTGTIFFISQWKFFNYNNTLPTG